MSTRSSAAPSAAIPGLRVAIGPLLAAALGAGTLGALLLAVAPALTVAVADDGARTDPAFPAGPLLALLALAPVALAWALAARDRSGMAAGVLAGVAALAPGRALLDLQLLVAPWRAARPELLVPTSLAPLRPGAGAWALLLGHLATVAAGVLALLSVRRPLSPVPATVPPATPADRGSATALAGSAALPAALCLGAVAAVGLVTAPFRSSDPYLLPRAAVDAPALVMLGMLAMASGAVLAACLAAGATGATGATGTGLARGALLGAGIGIASVALPVVLVVAASPDLSLTGGPPLALAGAAGLLTLTRLIGREVAPMDDDLNLPTLDRLYALAGVVAAAAGLTALLGAVVDQVSVPAGMPQPELYTARLLVPAGLLLVVLGGVLLLGARAAGYVRFAALARPALAVAWAGTALAGMAVLDAALTATQIAGVRGSAGVWAAGVALLLAPGAASVAAVAGSVERDEVDLSELHQTRSVTVAGVLAAVLALPAFGLPLRTAPDYAEAGLWSNFGVASWGLLAAAVAVVAAGLLAPWSRPSRAAGLLLGAAAVVAVHLSRLPLMGGRTATGATVAAGTWFALACLVVLVTGALLAWRAQRPVPHGTKYPAGRAN